LLAPNEFFDSSQVFLLEFLSVHAKYALKIRVGNVNFNALTVKAKKNNEKE
jgi:hypothetical protein